MSLAHGWLFPGKHTLEPSTGTKTEQDYLLARAGYNSLTQGRHFLIRAQKQRQFVTETLIAIDKFKGAVKPTMYNVWNITLGHV